MGHTPQQPKTNRTIISPLSDPQERRYTLAETARLLLSVLISAFGFWGIAWLCHRFYQPDITTLIEEGKALLPSHLIDSVRPEPLESLLYNLALLYFPFSLLGLYALFSHKKCGAWLIRPLVSVSCIYFVCTILLCVGVFTLCQPNPFVGSNFSGTDLYDTDFKVFFAPLLVAQKPLLYVVFTFVILGLFFLLSRLKPTAYKWTDRGLGFMLSLWALWLLSVIFRMHNYSFPDTWQCQYDFNAVYYSQTQTMAGQPVLIDGVSNTYGGYPLFLAPIFKLIGLDVANFTLVMNLLIVGAVLCWSLFLNRFGHSCLLMAAGLVALLFFGYLSSYLFDDLLNRNTFDSYFANAPIRWGSPAFALLLATLYCGHNLKVRSVVYYAAVLLLPLGIVWCPDFGLITWFAFLLFLLYQDFWMPSESRPRIAWKKELRHILVWLSGLFVSWGVFAIIMRLAYGAWIDYSLLFRTAAVFGKIGFFTLPMQAYHPWILVGVTFCIGLCYSLSAFYRRRITSRSAAIFLLSILGCGIFVYFKARSYHGNLFQPGLYAIMIGVLLTDLLWRQVREKRVRMLWLPCAIGLMLTCFSVPESIGAIKALQKLTQPHHGFTASPDRVRISNNKTFIRRCPQKTEKVWMLTSNKYQSLYLDKPLVKSAFNPGFLDLNMLEDFERALNTMRDSSFTVFLDGGAFYYPYWRDLRSMLAARYGIDIQQRQADKSFISALNPRQAKIPEIPVLERSGESPLLYRKYTDTPEGYHLRVQDGKGIPLELEKEIFSVEAIFRTSPQHYASSAVFSQYTGSNGFGFFHVNDDTKPGLFVFVCEAYQQSMQLPMQTWYYIVLNFYPQYVDMYINGRLSGRMPLSTPYHPSLDKFFIGDYQDNAHYFGAISEIAVYGRLKSAEEINNTMERFNASVK